MINKVPIICPGLRVHCAPDGVEVHQLNRVILYGNTDLGVFLNMCNGENSIEEIVASLTTNEVNFNEAIAGIAVLVEELESRGIIQFLETRATQKAQLNITRQSEYFPRSIALELTNKCNLKCIYCYQDSSPRLNAYLQNPIQLLSLLKSIGVLSVELTGGEPFLHPQFGDILSNVCNNFQTVGLVTNGTMITQEHIEIIRKGNAKTIVQICLDGDNKCDVDRIANTRGAWEMIIKGIKLVSTNGIRFRIGIVLADEFDYQKIKNIVDLALGLGAASVIASPVINSGRANKLGEFNFDRFLPIYNQLKLEYGEKFASESETYALRYHAGCGAGHRSLSVDWSGNIHLCVLEPKELFKLGKIKDIDLIIFQEKMSIFHAIPHPSYNQCGSCKYLGICSGCMVRALIGFKDAESKCIWREKNDAQLRKILQ
jgi:radical SAM protein with 4Fe4S-binding SPASM domain